MSHVVERCPNCGVEHDRTHVGPCEVCGTELRWWCTRHGAEAGWLAGPECPRCAVEARTREAAARTPPPPPPRPAPGPAPGPAEESPYYESPYEPPPRRGRAIRIPRPGRERIPADAFPPAGRDLGRVLRRGGEEMLPHVARGVGVAGRVAVALILVIRSVFGWGILGAVGGAGFAYLQPGMDFLWTVALGLFLGLIAGLFLGVILALRYLVSGPRSGDG